MDRSGVEGLGVSEVSLSARGARRSLMRSSAGCRQAPVIYASTELPGRCGPLRRAWPARQIIGRARVSSDELTLKQHLDEACGTCHIGPVHKTGSGAGRIGECR